MFSFNNIYRNKDRNCFAENGENYYFCARLTNIMRMNIKRNSMILPRLY